MLTGGKAADTFFDYLNTEIKRNLLKLQAEKYHVALLLICFLSQLPDLQS